MRWRAAASVHAMELPLASQALRAGSALSACWVFGETQQLFPPVPLKELSGLQH